MSKTEFYRCEICGNIALKVKDGGGKMKCCGQEMKIYETNTEGAAEKHLPIAKYLTDDILEISISEAEHPMEQDHYIEWIYLVTQHGAQAITLAPGAQPKAHFSLYGDKPLQAFALCNKHGLWQADISGVEYSG